MPYRTETNYAKLVVDSYVDAATFANGKRICIRSMRLIGSPLDIFY